MCIHKLTNTNDEKVMKNLEMLKFVSDHLKIK